MGMTRLTSSQKRLAAKEMDFALSIARLFNRSFPSLADEIESAAIWGLVLAARRYRPDRNTKFHSFAVWRIRGAIRDLLRKQIPSGYRRSGGRPALPDHPAVHGLGETEEQMASPADHRQSAGLEALLASLPPAHAEVIDRLYVGGWSEPETAERLGYTTARVAKLHAEALSQLRESPMLSQIELSCRGE